MRNRKSDEVVSEDLQSHSVAHLLVRLLMVCCLALVSARCLADNAQASESHADAQQKQGLHVLASFSILADWVAVIGGEHVTVDSLIGKDQDAHVFRATPDDVRRVREADMLVVNGLGYEGWLARLISASGFRGELVVATTYVAAIDAKGQSDQTGRLFHDGHDGHDAHDGHSHHHHQHATKGADPHAWHSLQAAKAYTRKIAEALMAADPANTPEYKAALARYHAQLDALQAEFRARFASVPVASRHIVVPHNSFAYLARDFDLRIHALQGISTEAQVSAKDMARIISDIRDNNIRAVFMENVSNRRLIAQVQRETGLVLGGELVSDALSAGVADTYLALMRHNLTRIVDALSGTPAAP